MQNSTAVEEIVRSSDAKPQLDGRRRVIIEGVSPEVDAGRFPAKRTVGDLVRVEADVFTDGHDSVAAVILVRSEKSQSWTEYPMKAIVNDRWFGQFPVPELGRYRYTIHAWVDHWETWRRDLLKRIKAEQDTPLDYRIGAEHIVAAAQRAQGTDATWLQEQAEFLNSAKGADARRQTVKELAISSGGALDTEPVLRDFIESGTETAEHRERAIDDSLNDLMMRYPDRRFATEMERELVLVVDPVRARFSAWYELFPRSTSAVPGEHGTLNDCAARLPYIADMGFDIVYLPPVHPIGTQFRKGRNNSVTAEPGEVGSPWAIGSAEGGHKSVHADLGTLEDFRSLVNRASQLGMQVAIDVAFQVAPDHPYVTDHEEWFRKRPDGSIQYAENPPKKYQDIYPFDFESSNWWGMWQELKSVFTFWIDQGVRIFRVDNPHTKAFPFWEWCITEIKRDWPETLFLSEAFTRPKIMYRLAKLGFSQSYTYFPWRNDKQGLSEYLTELSKTPVRDFFRPNQWPNTPDILTEFLQLGTRSAFLIRLLLAATLGANYGIYGPAFELLEARPVRPGSEEYLDSEKYQIRAWDLERPDSLREILTLVNRIRHDNPALQSDWLLDFHITDNDQLICYSKRSPDGSNMVLVVVNLDPHRRQSGFVDLDLKLFDIKEDQPFQVHDLLTGARYTWSGRRNYVELDPNVISGHIFRIRKRVRAENDFEYFL